MKLDYLKKAIQEGMEAHPLKISADCGLRYYTDFLNVATRIEGKLSIKGNRPPMDEARLNKKNDEQLIARLYLNGDLWQYLQTASEWTVLDYVIRNFDNQFVYEPQFHQGSKKNPECSFIYQGIQVNIEVKCPNLQKKIQQESGGGIKLYFADRIPGISAGNTPSLHEVFQSSDKAIPIHLVDRMDNKVKDFLKSAQKKFPDSTDGNFNVLVIATDILKDMDELYTALWGMEGVFTDHSFVDKSHYNRVDAVMLTNIVAGHGDYKGSGYNRWKLENYLNLLFLNPSLENTKTGSFYFQHGLDLFGLMTRELLIFQYELDKKENIAGVSSEQKRFEETAMITRFCKQSKFIENLD